MSVTLRGLTWNHSRAFPPLVAASQRFEELHPEIRVVWEKRSLDEFGHAGLSELSRSFDLLIIDHLMLGDVHRDRTLIDLQPRLPSAELEALKVDALGSCLESYLYESCLYALPIDAAAPAASYRADRLERHGQNVPTTWDQVIALARLGLVRMPGFPADLFLNFMGMCASRGSVVACVDRLFDQEVAILCLEELRELASYMPDAIYDMNPIALYESMAAGDEFAYCPFAYTLQQLLATWVRSTPRVLQQSSGAQGWNSAAHRVGRNRDRCIRLLWAQGGSDCFQSFCCGPRLPNPSLRHMRWPTSQQRRVARSTAESDQRQLL